MSVFPLSKGKKISTVLSMAGVLRKFSKRVVRRGSLR